MVARAGLCELTGMSKADPEQRMPKLILPYRPPSRGYQRPPREMFTSVPDHAQSLMGS